MSLLLKMFVRCHRLSFAQCVTPHPLSRPHARFRDCFPYYEAAFTSAFTIIPSLSNNPFFLFPTYFPYALSFSVQEDTIKGVFAFICSSLAMISEKERFGNEMDPKLLPSNCNSAIYRLFDLTVTYSSGVKTSI